MFIAEHGGGGTRPSSRTGIPAGMSFEEWVASLPPATVAYYLGRGTAGIHALQDMYSSGATQVYDFSATQGSFWGDFGAIALGFGIGFMTGWGASAWGMAGWKAAATVAGGIFNVATAAIVSNVAGAALTGALVANSSPTIANLVMESFSWGSWIGAGSFGAYTVYSNLPPAGKVLSATKQALDIAARLNPLTGPAYSAYTGTFPTADYGSLPFFLK